MGTIWCTIITNSVFLILFTNEQQEMAYGETNGRVSDDVT